MSICKPLSNFSHTQVSQFTILNLFLGTVAVVTMATEIAMTITIAMEAEVVMTTGTAEVDIIVTTAEVEVAAVVAVATTTTEDIIDHCFV